MKTIKLWLTTIAALLCSITTNAYDFEVEGIYYDITSSTNLTVGVTSEGTEEYSGAVIIPTKVIYDGVEYSVTSVGSAAFSGCTNLTDITIPEGVTSIGGNAFNGCENLTHITIPNSMTRIAERAFRNTNLPIDNDIRYADAWAVEVTDDTKDKYSLRNNTIGVAESTFSNCTNLTSITIPESVTSIGNSAFSGCSSLTSINIPEGVTSIGQNTFSNTNLPVENNIRYAGTWVVGVTDNTKDKYTLRDNTTGIADYMFQNCSMTEITLPNNLKYIGNYVCVNCRNLTSLTIPNSVTSIGVCAFMHCWSVTSLTIPSSVTSIGNAAFTGRGDGTSIVVDANNTVYDSRGNCNAIICTETNHLIVGCSTTIIPNSVTSIGDAAFMCCGITSVIIPNGVPRIGNSAFLGSGLLTSISIPSSVTDIESDAFADCRSLKTIVCRNVVPPTCEEEAFLNVDPSIPVYVPSESISDYCAADGWKDFTNIRPITTYEDWTSDNKGQDGKTSSKTYTIVAPIGATLLFDWSVSSETNSDELIVTLDNEQVLVASGEQSGTFEREIAEGEHTLEVKYVKDGSVSHGNDQASLSNVRIDVPEIIDGVAYKSISNNAVAVIAVDDKTDVVIPATITINNATYNVTEVSATAFSSCPNLTTVTIPEGVTEIKSNTFENCSELTSVTLPSTLKTIGSSAFKGCASLENITIPDAVVSIGGSAFQACASLTGISLPDGVTYISSRTFSECTNLASIDIPQTLTSIDSYAFYDCGNMQTMTIPASVSWIGNNAFTGCGGELYLNCQTSYNSWGGSDGAYYDSKFTKITIGAGITEIKQYAFYCCRNLSEVILPNTVTTIDRNAFEGTNLSTIELPAGIKTIGYNAFPYTMSKMTCNATTPPDLLTENNIGTPSLGNISIIYVPQGGSKQIYKDTYPWSSKTILDGSENPIVVTVTPGMMGEEILKQTNYLADVNFLTLSGAINDIDIANIKNSMPNLVSIDMSGLDMKNIPHSMFADRKALLSIILPRNVENIENNVFINCINLESIVFPEGLKRIGDTSYSSDGNWGSFKGCSSLKSVLFPSSLESLGYGAFQNCSRLQHVDFKEGLTEIGIWTFANCTSLTNLTLPKSLKSISGGAFYNCSSLRTVKIPEGVSSIGYEYENGGDYYSTEAYGAFENCNLLKQITLPIGLKVISQNTFSNCRSLTLVEIPEGVSFIGRNAFAECSNLVSVSLPSTLASCSSTPFANCNKLSEVSCFALLPPTLADGLLTLENMGLPLKRTLKVPEWTINRYKLTSGWAAFTQIEPITGIYPSSINVTSDAVLTLPTSGLPANYRPDMAISAYEYMMGGKYNYSASLHLRGSGTLQLNSFSMSSNGMNGTAGTQLLNEAQMEAESVSITTYLNSYSNGDYYGSSNNGWYFLSFPFDVKISEVSTNCEWVVRQYDGKARANNKLDNTWVTVPKNSTLNAGQGYIWACTGGSFTLPAVDNANKNLIFATTQRDIPLQEYAAELVSNSSWNLVGNPFPCYYNTNELDYTAPITVWENNTYAAYSPVDDNYVLRPFEAFFVQCPAGVKSIGFKPEGRQLTGTVSTPSNPMPAPSRTHAEGVKRQVINLTLSNEQGCDRTRIVINDKAKMDYELSCDAAKFMSDDADIPQLFSVCGDEKYAINERPMGNGVVKLGTRFATNGTYTIAKQSASSMEVVLVDNKTGVETNLAMDDYTFNAETTDTDRFEVRMYADEDITAIETITAKVKVTTVENAIVVIATNDAEVELYTSAGNLVATAKGKNLTFDAVQGVYIVKVNGVSHKVTVVK